MQKLVRDLIPGIIEKTGRRCNLRVLDEKEYFSELKKKLVEEVDEFLEEPNLEELADIMEVVHALAKAIGHDDKKLDELRCKKKSERGAFEQKLFLESADN